MNRIKQRLSAFALAAALVFAQVIPVYASGVNMGGNNPVGASGALPLGLSLELEDWMLDPGYRISYPEDLIRVPLAQTRAARARATASQSISNLSTGDIVNVVIDGYNYPFYVASKNYAPYGANGVVLMSAQIIVDMEVMILQVPQAGSEDKQSAQKYVTAVDRTWLNTEFYGSLPAGLRNLMIKPKLQTRLYYEEGRHYDSVLSNNTITDDYVFLPALHEFYTHSAYDFTANPWDIGKLKDSIYPLEIPDGHWGTTRDGFVDARTEGTNYWGAGRYFPLYSTLLNEWGALYNSVIPYYSIRGLYELQPCIYIKPTAKVTTTKTSYTTDTEHGGSTVTYQAYDFVYNTPPTAPGTVTVPSSINQWQSTNIPVSWTAATDAEGDTITYTLERSINGGGYTQITTTTSTSYTDTVTSAMTSNVRYRVKAGDGQEESGYSVSGTCSIVWDTTKPTINISAAPAQGTWTAGNVTLTVTLADSQSGLKTLVVPSGITGAGAATLSGATDTKTYTVTANGSYKFTVTDGAGNQNEATAQVSNIDREQPTVTTVLNPSGYTSGNVDIELAFMDSDSGLASVTTPAGSVTLSGASATHTYTATANSEYTFTVKDKAGNSTTEKVTVDKIDRTAPTLELACTVTDYTNAASVTITAAAVDDLSGVKHITLPDGNTVTGASAQYTITENGTYTFKATDNTGNETQEQYTFDWFDRTAPKLLSVQYEKTGTGLLSRAMQRMVESVTGEQVILNEQVRLRPTFSDIPEDGEKESGVSTFSYRLHAADSTPLGSWNTVDVTAAAPTIDYEMDGYLLGYVTDAAGNQSDTRQFDILLDGTAPEISYTASETGFTRYPVTVTLQGQDALSGFRKFVVLETGEEFATHTMSHAFESNGSQTFRGYDRAGNYIDQVVTVSNIDLTPPRIDSLTFETMDFTLMGRQMAINDKVKLQVRASDTPRDNDAESGVDTFSFRIFDEEDNALTAWQTVPIDEVEDIPPIDMEFNGYVLAYVTDAVGHNSYDENDLYRGEKFPIVIDKTKPTITYTLDRTTYTNQPVTATIKGHDDSSGFHKFILPDTGEEVFADTMDYVFCENGSITVQGYDRAGNYDEATITVDYIDLTPPTLEIQDNENQRQSGKDPITFTVVADDDLSGVDGITLPDNSYVKGREATFTAYTNGTYLFSAKDVAGNIMQSYSVVISSITEPDGNEGNEGGGSGDGNENGGNEGDGDGGDSDGNENSGNGGGSGNSSGGSDKRDEYGQGDETDLTLFDPDAEENGSGSGDNDKDGNANDNPQMGGMGIYPYWQQEELTGNRLRVLLGVLQRSWQG